MKNKCFTVVNRLYNPEDLNTTKLKFNFTMRSQDNFTYMYMYSDNSYIRTRLFPVDISGLTSFPDYWIAH